MKLFLQFGYGMMQHCRTLISAWGGGTVVLSPRDLVDGQLRSLAQDITSEPGGKVWLDPQFYVPHSDHERLRTHAYFPADFVSGDFFSGPGLQGLLERLSTLNRELKSDAYVLPGLFASSVDDQWLSVHAQIADRARDHADGRPLIATLALSADAVRDGEQVEEVLESAKRWDVAGFYLVCEHPNGDYLVREPNWLANVLDLTAGLRLAGKRVVIGYCNHQLLPASMVGASAICSGTWMNVRSFPPDKFRANYDDEVKQRATWYYCPQALSEYKVPFLDIAKRQGILDLMRAPGALDGGFAEKLFGAAQPTSVGFSEQSAFRHYLHALHGQVAQVSHATYDEARAANERILDEAETLIGRLTSIGVRGQLRDFAEAVDVGRAAIALIDSLRGPLLRRNWKAISSA